MVDFEASNLQTSFSQTKGTLFSSTCRVTSVPLPSCTIILEFLKKLSGACNI
jgi:hypothetical protein